MRRILLKNVEILLIGVYIFSAWRCFCRSGVQLERRAPAALQEGGPGADRRPEAGLRLRPQRQAVHALRHAGHRERHVLQLRRRSQAAHRDYASH